MQILIAEDDPISRRVLETTLRKWGHAVVVTTDGQEALEALAVEDPPRLAILDWMMPRMDGVEVCQRVQANASIERPYIILLTAKADKSDIAAGLEAGANDYVIKPFNSEELRARTRVGIRMVELQRTLAERVRELEQALQQVSQLEGILPICSYCKSIRDGTEYWQKVETYLSQRSAARFSHSICPDCYEKVVLPDLLELQQLRD